MTGKMRLIILVCLMGWVATAFCQSNASVTGNGWPFPAELNGTMMAYDFDKTDSITPWGDDMKPVFISYMARHGARFLSSEKKIDKIKKELNKASQEGNISRYGKDFLGVIEMVDSATGGNWGDLNPTGIYEEKTLGSQMYKIAPNLLKEAAVEAKATYVPRVVMTMYELCHELARKTSGIEVSTAEGSQFNSLLRYFKTDTAYAAYIENGSWVKTYERYADSVTPCFPAAKMFVTPPDDYKLRKLTMDMYGILQSLQASGLDAPVSEWFTEKEYESCWVVDNLKHYYQRSVSEFSDVPAQAAAPLLRDIVSTIDDALSGQIRLRASLLFGHAETVIPLFALMRLPGCYAPGCAPDKVGAVWKDYDIAPLGANLLIVVLENADGCDPCVSMRLNGEWLAIDGEKVMAWTKLKSLWNSYVDAKKD